MYRSLERSLTGTFCMDILRLVRRNLDLINLFFYFSKPLNIHDAQGKLFLMCEERWSKLRRYSLVKNNSYVMQNLTKSQRSLCAQLSSGTCTISSRNRFNCFPEEKETALVVRM